MKLPKYILLGTFLFTGGCAFFEALGIALGDLARQAEGEPDIYVARTSNGTFSVIERVTLVRARDGAPRDVLFEGWRRDFKRLGETGRFDSYFTAFSMRADGDRLAGVLEEDIGDTVEAYAFIFATEQSSLAGRTLLEVTDGVIARDTFDLCVDQDAARAVLDRVLIEDEWIEPNQPYEVTFDYLPSGGPLGQWPVFFGGWTDNGDVLFESDVSFDAIVTTETSTVTLVGGDDFPIFNAFRGTYVVYSGDTGEPIACAEDAGRRSSADPIYNVRSERVSTSNGFFVEPPDGGRFTVFNFPATGTPPQRLLLTGEIFGIVGPVDP